MAVVNKKTYKGNGIYIGRPSGQVAEHYGNPFSCLANSKADYQVESWLASVNCFEWWVRGISGQHVAVDAALKNPALIRRRNWIVAQLHKGALREQTLICWCSPKPCHGQVLEKLQAEVK